MRKELRGNSQGFTLIELMIVIAIIGILAAIAIPNFIAYRDKAYCSKVEVDAQNVLAALASYFSEPDHTSVADIDRLEEEEDLLLSGDNVGTLREIPNNTGEFEVQIQDASGRCPRADHDNTEKMYFVYMGTTARAEWKIP